MTPKLKELQNELEQAMVVSSVQPAYTMPTAHTTSPAHTETSAYTVPPSPAYTTSPAHTVTSAYTVPPSPAHTTSTSHMQHAQHVEEPPQGSSGFFTQLDTRQQIQDLHTSIQRLQTDNTSLRTQLRDLNERYAALESELETVKADLAAVRASPPPQRHPARGWHQRAHGIIGTADSRSAPTHTYECAHARNGGCTWRNKRVTLQAYVLHLQRKHRQNISSTPNMDLLPVLSSH